MSVFNRENRVMSKNVKGPAVGLWMYRNGGGEHIEQQIVAGLNARGIECCCDLDLGRATANDQGILCNDVRMEDLSLFFTYNAGQQSAYQVYLYHTLSRHIPIINNYQSFVLTEDKYQTNYVLHQSGVPTSDARLLRCDDEQGLMEQFRQWGGAMVYKPTDGWGGRGIIKVDNEVSLEILMAMLRAQRQPYFYVERLINYDKTDIRIDVVDGEFIGCYGRKAAANSWKTNVTSGGSVITRQADDEAIELALKAASVTGLEIAGVDLLYDLDLQRYVVLEVNGIPAFATPEQEAMGLDFNQRKINKIVELIDRKVAESQQLQGVHYENIA